MKQRIIIGLLCCAVASSLWATNEVNRDVTVERDYNPTIQQVPKQVLTPQKEDLKPEPLPVTYSSWTQPEEVSPQPTMQKAADAALQRSYDYKKGTAKVGFGFYLQTLAEFYYPLLQGDKYLLDINANHFSNWSKINLPDGTSPRGMSNYTDVALNYEHQFTDMRLNMKAGYAYTGYDYYGMSTEPVTPFYKDTVGRNSAVEVEAKLFSTNTKQSAQFEVGLDYLYFGRNFGVSMHEIGVDADVSGAVGNGRLGGAVKLDVHVLGMEHGEAMGAKPASSGPSTGSGTEEAEGSEHSPTHTAGILTLNPYYAFGGEDWGVKIGANMFAHIARDSVNWPVSGSANITSHFGIVPELFYLYANLGGSYSSNDYFSIIRENKYITPNLVVEPTYTPIDIDLGLKVRIMQGLLFDVHFDYELMLNQYYYVNHVVETFDEDAQVMKPAYYTNTFDVVYDPTSHRVSAGAGLHFDYVKGLNLSASVAYNYWTTSQQAYAWQKPSWEINFKGTYQFLEKWEVGVSYAYLAGRMALVQGEAVRMNDLHDVNLWASYQALDWLSVFVEGKNLANIESDVYYGYESFGINAMAGVTFRF